MKLLLIDTGENVVNEFTLREYPDVFETVAENLLGGMTENTIRDSLARLYDSECGACGGMGCDECDDTGYTWDGES